jgi:hypothetical protein
VGGKRPCASQWRRTGGGRRMTSATSSSWARTTCRSMR